MNRKSAYDDEFPFLYSIFMESGPQTEILHETY